MHVASLPQIYEVQDLEQVGLRSLRHLGTGAGTSRGVRLTGNKKLCYTSTIDWQKLGIDVRQLDFKVRNLSFMIMSIFHV